MTRMNLRRIVTMAVFAPLLSGVATAADVEPGRFHHVSLNVTDPARSIAFYKKYFGAVEAQSAFRIRGVELQVVQPPAQVQEAFDEIIAAGQDEERSISQAKGDATETIERATAEAIELEQSSLAYRDAKVLEARGKAARFEALLVEYKLAPEVTRRRLYLETMEEILPQVDKMVIEPGSATVVPFLPMGQAQGAPLVLPLPNAEDDENR